MTKISILFDISTIFSFFVLPSLVQLISYVLMFLYPSWFFMSFVSVIMQTCVCDFWSILLVVIFNSLCSIFRMFRNYKIKQPKKLGQLKITKKIIKKTNNKNKFIMPQLIPFFFVNQLSFAFITLLALVYIFSKYILPLYTFQQVIRMYITKLSNKN